jgi:hypothetical protein
MNNSNTEEKQIEAYNSLKHVKRKLCMRASKVRMGKEKIKVFFKKITFQKILFELIDKISIPFIVSN